VPAYTPLSLQPLDAEGKAVQLMRSWFTAMPGETVSCVGCHEKQNTAPPVGDRAADRSPPAEIRPWYGPPRGFAFRREVQPVLDGYCLGCHNGRPGADGRQGPDFTDGPAVPTLKNTSGLNVSSRFSPSYYQLRRFVRTPTKESDMRVLPPWEYHADTTRLVQLLEKGHYNVRLDPESWDRLITWIDLNAPYHGNWTDIRGDAIGPEVRRQCERRATMRKRYTGMEDHGEAIYPSAAVKHVAIESLAAGRAVLADRRACPAWPFSAAEAAGAASVPSSRGSTTLSMALAEGVALELVRIPAGEFVMGQADGCQDERPPASRVKIASGLSGWAASR
jgi:hypothetical protein